MMKTSWLMPVVAIGVSLVASARAEAQPLFGGAESLESTVANADLVFVAKLVGLGEGGRPEAREGTIEVEETLKEDIFLQEHYRRLHVHLPHPAALLARWKDRSTRLLVAVKEDAPDATTVIPLTPEGLEVLTADFQVLRDPERVIRAAREAIRRMPAPAKRTHTFGLVVPREAVAGTKWESSYGTGGWLVLNVVVDERLEERARDGIRSESYQKREESARALRYFKSGENIERLKALLDDPGWAYLYHARENKGVEVRTYGVRREAYRTLKSWGVDVPEPMTREEVRE